MRLRPSWWFFGAHNSFSFLHPTALKRKSVDDVMEAKVTQLRQQVEEIKEIVTDTVEKAVERGEKIDQLKDRAHQLEVRIIPWS